MDLSPRSAVFVRAGESLVQGGRVELATEVLRYAESVLSAPGLTPDQQIRGRAASVAAWQGVANRDETRADLVADLTAELLDQAEDQDDARLQADVFRQVFVAQLSNANAGEAALRRTLDLAYLIEDDAVRAEVLVQAAETVEGQDDRIGLNPLVQQAIATVPALEDSLLAADLSARLARLSQVLGRDGDVATLTDRVASRAEAGLIVDPEQQIRLERIVRSLVDTGRADRVPTILANVAPQRARSLAYGWLADAHGRDHPEFASAIGDAFDTAGRLTDREAQARVVASLVRTRVEADPDWNPASEISALLANVRLAAVPAETREAVLVDVALAYVLSGQGQQVERLRGLIATGDEYNRVYVRVAEGLAGRGLRDEAIEYLGTVDVLPPPRIGDTELPAVRAARTWYRLGEYDRGISAVLAGENADVARYLVGLPPDHQINPATRGQLDRRLADS